MNFTAPSKPAPPKCRWVREVWGLLAIAMLVHAASAAPTPAPIPAPGRPHTDLAHASDFAPGRLSEVGLEEATGPVGRVPRLTQNTHRDMLEDWTLQSSAKLTAGIGGKELSSPDFNDSSWYPVVVPCTVVACLLQPNNAVWKDPFFDTNLAEIDADLFSVPWWYRTTVEIPADAMASTLTFKGLNYAANVWVNGQLVGTRNDTVGPFRYFVFRLTGIIKAGERAAIAVELFRPHDECFPPGNNSTDLSITFVDWSHPPPDGSMGLWREVELLTTDTPITVLNPMVATRLSGLAASEAGEGTLTAHLTLAVELQNLGPEEVEGTLTARSPVFGSVSTAFTLGPNSTVDVVLSNETFAALNVPNPALWWPAQLGDPVMHNVTIQYDVIGLSESLTTQFGIRETGSYLDTNGHRQYVINGKKILVRGAGWSPDLFLRSSIQDQRSAFAYMLHLGLNAVRLEGKMENDDFFDVADEMGVLVLPGWCCCDAWQHWDAWQPAQYTIARESMRSQALRLRIHPSVLVFLYSSDELPPPDVEQLYLGVFKAANWPNPVLASASALNSTISGPTGVKMSGPYAWVPPNYWLEGASPDRLGGAFGFLTEGSPGAAPLTLESWEWTVPEPHLWPISKYWDFHCGNPAGLFYNLRFFTPALEARYGTANSAAAYLQLAQVMSYESHRAMFEGYSVLKYAQSTGLVQWMLNNAMPEHIWHLYDPYWNQGGSYWGVHKANRPLHAVYSIPDGAVWLVNSRYSASSNVQVAVNVTDMHGSVVHQRIEPVSEVPPDSSLRVLDLKDVTPPSAVYFVRLRVLDAKTAAVLDTNDYWLSRKPDVIDWKDSNFYRTPVSSFADLTALTTLSPVTLHSSVLSFTPAASGSSGSAFSTAVSNLSPELAFFVRLRLRHDKMAAADHDVLPILWDDNYFTLMPGETRQVNATILAPWPPSAGPELVVEVFNNVQW